MNNLPRYKLSEIIKRYGKNTCNDHKRLKGLLNDFCSGDYPEINFLMMALEENVNIDLMRLQNNVSYDVISSQIVKRLYTNRGMADEIAHWAVDSWALALGMISSETLYTKPVVMVSTPPTRTVNIATSFSSPYLEQTIIVSPIGGDYTTISTAIRFAPPDTLILVKPGYYYEGLIINKRIKIKGDGPREQIIVESRDTPCIQMQTNDEVLVQSLTLRCHTTHPSKKNHAVDIPMGRLKLLGCDITSDSLACVAITGQSAHPVIQRCWLHDAGGSGLLIEPRAQGTIEDCHIFNNGFPGIAIKEYANPIIRRCKVYGGRNHGILVWKDGYGTIEDCNISGNAYDGVKVRVGGSPIVKECCIYGNKQQESWVYQNGMGNTGFPKITVTPDIRQQRGNSEFHSETFSRKYIPENVAYWQETSRQQEVAQQPEKRPNLLDLFLRTISFRKRK